MDQKAMFQETTQALREELCATALKLLRHTGTGATVTQIPTTTLYVIVGDAGSVLEQAKNLEQWTVSEIGEDG